MYRIGQHILVAVAFVATPAAAEICLSATRYDVANFAPDCAIYSAFAKAFGGPGRPRPQMTQEPQHLSVGPNGQRMITFTYNLALFDNGYFRALGRNSEVFSASALSFSEELEKEICERTSWLDGVEHGDGAVEFWLKIRLDATADVNETLGFPKELRVTIESCETN
jgi:hypothetical protein